MSTPIATRSLLGYSISINDPDIPHHRVLLTRAQAGQLLRELVRLTTDLGTMLDTPGYPETTPTQPTPTKAQP